MGCCRDTKRKQDFTSSEEKRHPRQRCSSCQPPCYLSFQMYLCTWYKPSRKLLRQLQHNQLLIAKGRTFGILDGMTTAVYKGSTESVMHSDLKCRWECGPDQPPKDLAQTLLYLEGMSKGF